MQAQGPPLIMQIRSHEMLACTCMYSLTASNPEGRLSELFYAVSPIVYCVPIIGYEHSCEVVSSSTELLQVKVLGPVSLGLISFFCVSVFVFLFLNEGHFVYRHRVNYTGIVFCVLFGCCLVVPAQSIMPGKKTHPRNDPLSGPD